MPQSLNSTRNIVFFSYAPRDQPWLERLEIHLDPLLRRNQLTRWSARQVLAGEKQEEQEAAALHRACAIVLLVSADYLATAELDRMLKAAAHGAKVLWLPVRASAYSDTALDQLTPLVSPTLPLGLLAEEEAELRLVQASKAIAEAARAVSAGSAAAPGKVPEARRTGPTGLILASSHGRLVLAVLILLSAGSLAIKLSRRLDGPGTAREDRAQAVDLARATPLPPVAPADLSVRLASPPAPQPIVLLPPRRAAPPPTSPPHPSRTAVLVAVPASQARPPETQSSDGGSVTGSESQSESRAAFSVEITVYAIAEDRVSLSYAGQELEVMLATLHPQGYGAANDSDLPKLIFRRVLHDGTYTVTCSRGAWQNIVRLVKVVPDATDYKVRCD